MRKKILTSFVLLGCLNLLNAQNEVSIEEVDREVMVKASNSKHLDDLIITISIKTKDTLEEGDRALASLRSNLDFINKVATSQAFRDCIVAKEYKKDVLTKQERAKRLLDEKRITDKQYLSYTEEQESALVNLNNRISNICKEGE